MPIVGDTKNWTWVLERACPECAFDASAAAYTDVPGLVRANAAAWPEQLRRADVRERPDPATWSPLEYAAHVRDVFVIFRERLELMLTREAPTFENWDQDATAVEQRYLEQDPVVVERQLLVAAEELATAFAAVPARALDRTGSRSDGSEFTVETLARYLVHDPIHHLHDVLTPHRSRMRDQQAK